MLPAAFVWLEQMPLTANGKLDRQALPAPEGRPELEGEYVAPRSPVEQVLAGIWAELMHGGRVGVEGNFFEAGGGSILTHPVVAPEPPWWGGVVAARDRP